MPAPRRKGGARPARLSEADVPRLLDGLSRGKTSVLGRLLGLDTPGLRRVLAKHIAGNAKLARAAERFVQCHRAVELGGDEFALAKRMSAGRLLRDEVTRLGGSGSADALAEIEQAMSRPRAPGRVAAAGGRGRRSAAPTLFDVLRRLGAEKPDVDGLRRIFEDAIASGDERAVREAAANLVPVVPKETAARMAKLVGQRPAGRAGDPKRALDALRSALDALPPNDPARRGFAAVVARTDTDTAEWLKIADVVARAAVAKDADEAASMILRVRGAATQVMARHFRPYAREFEREVKRARRLAAGAERFDVAIVRSEVRQFSAGEPAQPLNVAYQDAVFLLSKEGPDRARAVLLTRVSAGDGATGSVAAGVADGIRLEKDARVVIDGRRYRLEQAPFAIRRIVIGRSVPSPGDLKGHGAAIKSIELDHPPESLDALAVTALAANGKLPGRVAEAARNTPAAAGAHNGRAVLATTSHATFPEVPVPEREHLRTARRLREDQLQIEQAEAAEKLARMSSEERRDPGTRLGVAKPTYNSLEWLTAADLQLVHPDRGYVMQVELVSVVTPRREVKATAVTRRIDRKLPGRKLDILEVRPDGSFGDLETKTNRALVAPFPAGGVEVEDFKSGTTLKKEIDKTNAVFDYARRHNGKVRVRGLGLDGRPVEMLLDPAGFTGTVAARYREIPN